MSKICGKCGDEKELSEFSKNKNIKCGHISKCKKIYDKEYNIKNSKEISRKKKLYYEKFKEYINEKNRIYKEVNKESLKHKGKIYCINNKHKRNEYLRNRTLEEPLFKLSCNIRKTIGKSIKKCGYKKSSKSYDILGCTFEEFMIHLNNNEYGFIYGDNLLDLDHIIPLISATSEEEIIKLNHYSNFQLLPRKYNQHIKKHNEWDKEHFDNWLLENKL